MHITIVGPAQDRYHLCKHTILLILLWSASGILFIAAISVMDHCIGGVLDYVYDEHGFLLYL